MSKRGDEPLMKFQANIPVAVDAAFSMHAKLRGMSKGALLTRLILKARMGAYPTPEQIASAEAKLEEKIAKKREAMAQREAERQAIINAGGIPRRVRRPPLKGKRC